eukprot:scaffold995_cov358-Pavlova_lutheri.AAC.19
MQIHASHVKLSSRWMWVMCVVAAWTVAKGAVPPLHAERLEKKGKTAYGILLDAGSGSTKGHIYTWNVCYEFMPDVKLLHSMKKVRPDLASYAPSMGGDPAMVGNNLQPILDKAQEVIPQHMWKYTPVFLTATAGMRLLPETDRAIVLRRVNLWLADPDNHPFLYGTKGKGGQFWAQTISGDVEGVYGFIDVNFLLGNLHGQNVSEMVLFDEEEGNEVYKEDSAHEVAGWIDMGGASLQVSFAPQESTIISNVYPIYPLQYEHVTTSTGSTYASTYIYTHSWNGFGQRAARTRMQNSIYRKASGGSFNVLSDPCLLRGNSQVIEIDGANVTFIGSGDFYACQWFVDDFVLDMKNECLLPPCGAAGVHVPPVDKSHFYGFTKMLEIARPLGYAKKKGSWSPTYQELESALARVCNMTSAEAEEYGIKNDYELQSGPCFRGVLMMRFLQIMGSPEMTFADRVNRVELDYSRGAMLMLILYESLYPTLTPKGWPSCDEVTVGMDWYV